MNLSENFIDRVEVYVKSGKGGNGIVHFRHEKYVPKGGPDGGNGGNGGSVIFKVNNRLSTLNNLRYCHHIYAKNGEDGGKNNSTGKNAGNIIIEIPSGTVIFNKENNEKLADLIDNGAEYVIKGGKGGLGNTNFKTPTNQTPLYAQKGEDGIEFFLILELSILSDVGLVGFPNVGKSTLLSVLTNAKPKIGNYPFTTLSPQLGILRYKNSKECSIADFPGIIKGSSFGKGLGIRFLQHIKRVKLLIFVVDINANINEALNILKTELSNFDTSLLNKPSLVCISKYDLGININTTSDEYIYVSSFTRYGLDNLIDNIFRCLNNCN